MASTRRATRSLCVCVAKPRIERPVLARDDMWLAGKVVERAAFVFVANLRVDGREAVPELLSFLRDRE